MEREEIQEIAISVAVTFVAMFIFIGSMIAMWVML